MRKLKYLFTGTGRCGTGYISKVMTSVGIPCGHEVIFNAQGCGKRVEQNLKSNPDLVADSSWQAAICLKHPCLANAKVVHVVRHPKRVIESHMNYHKFNSDVGIMTYKKNAVPEMMEFDTNLERLIYFFVKWNAIIEERAYILHRIEDDIGELLDELEPQCDRENIFNNKTYNSWHSRYKRALVALELNEIPSTVRSLVQSWTEGYGYDWDDPPPRI